MKRFAFWLVGLTIFISLTFSSESVYAQQKVGKADIKITLKENRVEDRMISLSYSIPFDGMVELTIYNTEDKRVYRNQYMNKVGDNQIKINRKPTKDTPGHGRFFPPGNYVYELYYKGTRKTGSIVLR